MATFPIVFRLRGLHFPGTPLARRPANDIAKLAVTRPGLADAGSAIQVATTSSIRSKIGGLLSSRGRMSDVVGPGILGSFSVAGSVFFDHGYAVTSHSSQGLTAERVLVNMDTDVHPELINNRFAYVSVSRATEGAQNLHRRRLFPRVATQ